MARIATAAIMAETAIRKSANGFNIVRNRSSGCVWKERESFLFLLVWKEKESFL
jgi:hypothetical protein